MLFIAAMLAMTVFSFLSKNTVIVNNFDQFNLVREVVWGSSSQPDEDSVDETETESD